MIWFEEVLTRKKLSKIFYRYERTFPEDERRSKEQFLFLADHPDAFVYNIHKEDTLIGYAVIWELTDFFFLEHFEIFEDFRNQKLGEATLEAMKEKFGKIILETERETHSEIAKRRLQFYERNGFGILEKNYTQPSYGEGKPSLKLILMGNFIPQNLETAIQEIYENVYEVDSE
jgi:GNAT superfamily N-acetyltransferase